MFNKSIAENKNYINIKKLKNSDGEIIGIDKSTGEVLPEFLDDNKKFPLKKMFSLYLVESYKRLNNPKAYRVAECGTFLEYKYYLKHKQRKLNQANFCKVRLCPMCSWRRSLKIFGQVSKVMDHALEKQDYRFIFLTLTCKNVEGSELSNTIDSLFKAYKKLSERKIFKQSIKGWFRGLEINYDGYEFITKDMYYGNPDKKMKSRKRYYDSIGIKIGDRNPNFDQYHPHFHVVLMVNKSYFNDRNYYISQDNWTSLWKSCLKVDYTPIVHVRAFKTGSKSETSKSVAESAKYTVKDSDLIVMNDNGEVNEIITDKTVEVLDDALANRRLTAFGGELRRIHKLLNLDDSIEGDLINTDNEEELRNDLEFIIERYSWNVGYSNYVKVK